MTDYERGYHQGKADAMKTQEPACWYDKHGMITHDPFEGVTPLYKSPRLWVGLTEEEIKECFTITPDLFLPWHIYTRIETKLKQKNEIRNP